MTALLVIRLDDKHSALQLYRRLRSNYDAEIHSAVPLEHLQPPADARPEMITRITATAAVVAMAVAVGLQYYTGQVAYPTDVGGRPESWLTYIFVAVAFAMMCSALSALVAFLRFSRLPNLRDRLFSAEAYEKVGRDDFLVTVDAPAETCGRLRGELAQNPRIKQIELIEDED